MFGAVIAERLLTILDELDSTFEAKFSLWDCETGKRLELRSENEPHDGTESIEADEPVRAELARSVGRGRSFELVGDADGVCLLAIPIPCPAAKNSLARRSLAALAPFATSPARPGQSLTAAASLLGMGTSEARAWLESQAIWRVQRLEALARAVTRQLAAEAQSERLEREVESLAGQLALTYEEISLLYDVSQRLRISTTDESLGRLALDWLIECLPAECLALEFLPVAKEGESTYKARTHSALLLAGKPLLNEDEFTQLIERYRSDEMGPVVVNFTSDDPVQSAIAKEPSDFPWLKQLILTPIHDGQTVFGWLGAFNHRTGAEFGTVEAALLNSIAAIQGIHCGNHELYRQQAEFMANVVRALTSAIDAKDPYTCGHSDRVARVAVRLAQELGCDNETLHTLYMSGLLHDIGKIGIDDTVLRKPGRLTEAEYEHIKLHPVLGYKILADIKQFANVLPVVLHHHEQWDGRGYPSALTAEETPWLARITAVADAFDAMSSDRPYRKGMPESEVDAVFRDGAGKQWDPKVIDAFFAAREDIRRIGKSERADLSLDVQQWI